MVSSRVFYQQLRSRRPFIPADFARLLSRMDQSRVQVIAESLSNYFETNMSQAIRARNALSDYRLNPYVLLTAANSFQLSDMQDMARFLFNTKAYMGLETSFGKSLETTVLPTYPISESGASHWETPIEKLAEQEELQGLGREERARIRTESVWREIDASSVTDERRYLLTIKSGPNTINDSQVEAMRSAIANNYRRWLADTRRHYNVNNLDIVIGLTYGTDKTTNNKENQILVKLLDSGFIVDEHAGRPGVLIDGATGRVRIYRCIGVDFWAAVGHPADSESAEHVFLEVLFGLARALTLVESTTLEDLVNSKISELATALRELTFPGGSLPDWVRDTFTASQLAWLVAALNAFYDVDANL